ncbi:MAG: GntR family transcriptional regulator [Proteobacteria bacterium]|nr:GntR family transcriptional regulator [Pseudomonadota bacterium]
MYGVSRGTVRKTLELLEKDGLISNKRGVGKS